MVCGIFNAEFSSLRIPADRREECFQDFLLACWEYMGKYDPDFGAKPITYLHGSAKFAAMKMRRPKPWRSHERRLRVFDRMTDSKRPGEDDSITGNAPDRGDPTCPVEEEERLAEVASLVERVKSLLPERDYEFLAWMVHGKRAGHPAPWWLPPMTRQAYQSKKRIILANARWLLGAEGKG